MVISQKRLNFGMALKRAFSCARHAVAMPGSDGGYDSPMIIDAHPHEFVGDGDS
jgi:hypothetical protein